MMRFTLGMVLGGIIYAALPDSVRTEISAWLGQSALWVAALLATVGVHLTGSSVS